MCPNRNRDLRSLLRRVLTGFVAITAAASSQAQQFPNQGTANYNWGVPYGANYNYSFMRYGEGGFGGDRGPSSSWVRPEREPDQRVEYGTRPEQALLYRLSGDHNPLHSDPTFAAGGGFERPILHGLCTYGFTGRALLHALCGSDPTRFGTMHARFTRPVLPGDTLVISMWAGADGALFQTATQDGTVVLDHGRFNFAKEV